MAPAKPMMISDDLLSMSSASLQTVSNSGVIAIDQDPAGVQGWQVQGSVSANGEAFEKPLSDGSYAIALLNRGSATQVVATSTVAAARLSKSSKKSSDRGISFSRKDMARGR